MKKLVLFLTALLSAGALFAQDCSDIFMSEYVEGWNNNKCVELYNPTNLPITLDGNYRLIRFSNGSTTSDTEIAYTLPLATTIAPYSVMVIIQDTIPAGQDTMVWPGLRKHATWLAPYAYATSPPYTPGGNVVFWNGDDAVSLQKKQTNGTWKDIDIFGEIGVRPTNWQGTYSPSGAWTDTKPYIKGVGIYITKSKTLKRRHDIKHGVDRATMITYGNTTTGGTPNSFDALLEYDTLPVNFFDSLGQHWCDCKPAYHLLTLGPDQTVSAGSNVTLDAGEFSTYLWSTGSQQRTVTVDSAGVGFNTKKVWCRVTDSYGTQSDTIRITFSPNAVLNLGPDQTVVVGEIVSLDAGQFDTYVWSNGETTQTVKIDSSGVGYGTKKVYCTVTDIHGMQSDTVRITFKPHEGIGQLQQGINFSIQPNPVVNNQFTVTGNQTIASVEVISIVGQTVFSTAVVSHQKEVKVVLDEIPGGIYLVRISYGNNQTIVKKIIIQ
ncbi:MAG: lamin tail domain-containing protein [Bacteroidetes bacterium]|nr:lamin tail domain-containing protein [Bacteroidota bacterium]